jgi:hypothetical protein
MLALFEIGNAIYAIVDHAARSQQRQDRKA